jgi:hypothetical protein
MKRREFLMTPAAVAAVGQKDWVAARPRLYFSQQDLARVRERVKNSPLLDSAKRLLESQLVTEEVAQRGGGQHANYGLPGNQVSQMGLTLGLAYQVTGEKQYAEKLRDALLHYAGYQRWSGQGLDERNPAWHSELNTARFCYGFGAGYDAIHGFLKPEERKRIAEGMVRLGILPTLEDWVLPEKRIHALDSMGHNWWSVCVSMAGVSCLALLGDDDRAPEWVDRISRGLAQWFDFRGSVLQNKPRADSRSGSTSEAACCRTSPRISTARVRSMKASPMRTTRCRSI